jgi:anti-sigma factor RsiW
MSCSPFDLNDYFLDELSGAEKRQVEAHAKTCAECREEIDRLRIMGAALRSMPEEEIPQRIAFVSDKIFEPSPWRRRLAAFWNSGARLGFASAAMLSASLVVFAFRPAPVTIVRTVPAPASQVQAMVTQAALTDAVPQAKAAQISEAEIVRRIQVAVNRAVELKTVALRKALTETQSSLMMASAVSQADRDRAGFIKSQSFGPPVSAEQEINQ